MCHIGIWVCPIAPIRERMTEISRGGGGGVLWSAPRRLRLDGEAGGGVEEEGGVLGGGPAVVQILHRPVVARTRSLKSKIFQNINTDCLKNRKMSAYRILLYVQCTQTQTIQLNARIYLSYLSHFIVSYWQRSLMSHLSYT